MDEVLISQGYDMTRCVLTSQITLEFSNCFAYYVGGLDEVGDVDVSDDGGMTWTNVLSMSNDNFGPEIRMLDITPLAQGQSDLRVRFHYYNAQEEMWWLVDDMKLSCMATPEPGPDMTISCEGFEPPMHQPVTVRGPRPILPLRATLRNEEGVILTEIDIVSAPVAQVFYMPESYDGEMITQADLLDVTEATEGNIFEYNPATEAWYFHLPVSNYTQSGTYIVTMESTNEEEYEFVPKCEAQFTRP